MARSIKPQPGPQTDFIDRADNNLGYTKENSVPCCSECNFCKGTLSKDKFLDLVRKVYEHSFNTKA